jgi:6-hydroxycyclohex-1-ene-1-carbonyl-CoA dehydrogenase
MIMVITAALVACTLHGRRARAGPPFDGALDAPSDRTDPQRVRAGDGALRRRMRRRSSLPFLSGRSWATRAGRNDRAPEGLTMSVRGYGWALEAPKRPLVRVDRTWGDPPDGAVLLEVLGCGVCHTDLGFADGDVAPKAPLPLVLGHEIVGRVIAAGPGAKAELVGRRVLAPAVSPCGACRACRSGRATSCTKGLMPGNDADGGFASHVVVPGRDVVPLDAAAGAAGPIGAAGLEPWEIAPVADAATTAYQAVVRAHLAAGDVAIFVGAGGVGGFGAQIAHALGAKVIAIDVSQARLEALGEAVDERIDPRGLASKAIRDTVRARRKAWGAMDAPVRVFETSGTAAGQETAFDLLERGGSLSVVGFTRDKVSLRLSNVMALDAEIFGNWGCSPELYAGVIDLVLAGKVAVRPFVERRPMDDVNAVLDAVRAHAMSKRAVLVP